MKKQKRMECGVQRNRVAKKIRGHLLLKGLTATDLAGELGVSRQLVTATIRGERHSPLVLEKLRGSGVPERYLYDPSRVNQDMVA